MEVRPATREDVPGVQRVARRAWRATYEPFLGGEEVAASLDEWYARDALEREIGRDDVGFFVADRDGVFGYASCGPGGDDRADDEGVLGSLYVHPDRWGAGVGSRLLDRARAHLAARGLDQMRVEVFAANGVGVSFYESADLDRVDEHEVELFTGGTERVAVYYDDLG
jgi:ribosomal protein S18 acetylase RimI-like enzyme